MLGNLGFGELMVIMLIVLVLFGAKRVPEISASFGKGIREFKRNLSEVEGAVTSAVEPRAQVSRQQVGTPARTAEASPDDTRSEPKRLL